MIERVYNLSNCIGKEQIMKNKNIIIGVCCLVAIVAIVIEIMFLTKPKYEVTFMSDDKVLE